MYCKDKDLLIVPLADSKRQMVLVSKSRIEEEASKTAKGKQPCLSQIIRMLMKSVRPSGLQKLEQVLLPCFSLKE